MNPISKNLVRFALLNFCLISISVAVAMERAEPEGGSAVAQGPVATYQPSIGGDPIPLIGVTAEQMKKVRESRDRRAQNIPEFALSLQKEVSAGINPEEVIYALAVMEGYTEKNPKYYDLRNPLQNDIFHYVVNSPTIKTLRNALMEQEYWAHRMLTIRDDVVCRGLSLEAAQEKARKDLAKPCLHFTDDYFRQEKALYDALMAKVHEKLGPDATGLTLELAQEFDKMLGMNHSGNNGRYLNSLVSASSAAASESLESISKD